MASVAQVRANRLNAQKSTGPRTPEGKAVVAQNAVKHGLLAQQVVIRGEDPGEFELFRDRMVQDLAPAGSLESLLAERVAHLGWRLRRAERLDRAAWATLETDYAAREASRPPALRRPQGEAQDDEETVLARVVVDDFGRAKLLDRLLGYERRIENSLYRTVGELQKHKKWHEREAAQAEAESDMDATAGVVRRGGREGERSFAPTKTQDELRSSEEGGRGRPPYEEASGDATTNGAGPVGPSCETKPISGRLEVVPVPCDSEAAKREELGRGRPIRSADAQDRVYEEASGDASTNGGPVDPPASYLTLETSNLAAGRLCQTKPNDGPGPKSEGTRGHNEKVCRAHPTDFPLQTADAKRDVTSQPG
jgi:hypothetical protein